MVRRASWHSILQSPCVSSGLPPRKQPLSSNDTDRFSMTALAPFGPHYCGLWHTQVSTQPSQDAGTGYVALDDSSLLAGLPHTQVTFHGRNTTLTALRLVPEAPPEIPPHNADVSSFNYSSKGIKAWIFKPGGLGGSTSRNSEQQLPVIFEC